MGDRPWRGDDDPDSGPPGRDAGESADWRGGPSAAADRLGETDVVAGRMRHPDIMPSGLIRELTPEEIEAVGSVMDDSRALARDGPDAAVRRAHDQARNSNTPEALVTTWGLVVGLVERGAPDDRVARVAGECAGAWQELIGEALDEVDLSRPALDRETLNGIVRAGRYLQDEQAVASMAKELNDTEATIDEQLGSRPPEGEGDEHWEREAREIAEGERSKSPRIPRTPRSAAPVRTWGCTTARVWPPAWYSRASTTH